MENVRKNLHRLPILGRKMPKSVSNIQPENKQVSLEPNMPPKVEWLCPEIPQEPNIHLWCRECGDLRFYVVIETIENGNLVHRYKCVTCGVILTEEDR